MNDENFIDLYCDDTAEKEGIEIKGRDVILLDAPEVLLSPDTPLLTEAQDIAGAINELFQSGGEGSDGNLRVISDNDSDSLVIGIEKEESIVTENNYSYIKADFSETITIHKTINHSDGTQTTTTNTKSFGKSVITNLYDAYGAEIFHVECDDRGNVLGYFDADNNEIYVD